jgi:hypothetical protein
LEDLVSSNMLKVDEQLHLVSDLANETDLVALEPSPRKEIEVPLSTNNKADMVALESSPSGKMVSTVSTNNEPDMVDLELSPIGEIEMLVPSNEDKAEEGTANDTRLCHVLSLVDTASGRDRKLVIYFLASPFLRY